MVDLSSGAKALAAGETAPLMRGGTPVASYECEQCRAILARAPESLNPTMEYLHALLVYPLEYKKPPLMYVVAERANISAAALASLPVELRRMAESHLGSEAFLCAFTESGKYNLGADKDLESLEVFEARALETMRQALQITGPIRTLNDTRRGDSFPDNKSGSGCLVLICAAPPIGYGLVKTLWSIFAWVRGRKGSVKRPLDRRGRNGNRRIRRNHSKEDGASIRRY